MTTGPAACASGRGEGVAAIAGEVSGAALSGVSGLTPASVPQQAGRAPVLPFGAVGAPAPAALRLPNAPTDGLKAGVSGREPKAVHEVIFRLDRGLLRVAEKGPAPEAGWVIHGWIQPAINHYFSLTQSEIYDAGALKFFDKIPPKHDLGEFRVVPPGVVRYGAHVEKGAIVMPGYVNIGARVGGGSMVDTWATVGSCAQVGRGVHLSGGVGLGGVLEPPGARPVIIEDGAFIGSPGIVRGGGGG